MRQIEIYPTESDLTKTLIQKNSGFHKSCKVRYNKQMYERACKNINNANKLNEKQEDVLSRTTRKDCCAKNFLVECFFL